MYINISRNSSNIKYFSTIVICGKLENERFDIAKQPKI